MLFPKSLDFFNGGGNFVGQNRFQIRGLSSTLKGGGCRSSQSISLQNAKLKYQLEKQKICMKNEAIFFSSCQFAGILKSFGDFTCCLKQDEATLRKSAIFAPLWIQAWTENLIEMISMPCKDRVYVKLPKPFSENCRAENCLSKKIKTRKLPKSADAKVLRQFSCFDNLFWHSNGSM